MDPVAIMDAARKVQHVQAATQSVDMVLTSRSGAERTRRFELRIDRKGDVVRTYARFSHPSDVAGTQLVVIDNPDQTDTQLLYLPALGRVNRIAGRARSGSFMGSDFAYEDMELTNAVHAEHRLVSESDIGWVIASIPGDDSGYSQLIAHVRKADFLPTRIEFFDKKGQPLKILEVLESVKVGDTILPTRSVMRNSQRGTQTELKLTAWDLSAPSIPDEVFTATYMEENG
jgi:hypothetical protein